jgi:uncharacterized membrane protein
MTLCICGCAIPGADEVPTPGNQLGSAEGHESGRLSTGAACWVKTISDLPGGVGAPGMWSEAIGVSADGSRVVGFGTADDPSIASEVRQAIGWTAGVPFWPGGSSGLIGFGYGPSYGSPAESAASKVSEDGLVVVGYAFCAHPSRPTDGADRAAIWTASGMTLLPQPQSHTDISCKAHAVSAVGAVIAGYSSPSNDAMGDLSAKTSPVLWTSKPPGYEITVLPSSVQGTAADAAYATAISGAGELIAGVAYDTSVHQYSAMWPCVWRRAADGRFLSEALKGPAGVIDPGGVGAVSSNGLSVVGATGSYPSNRSCRWTRTSPAASFGNAQPLAVPWESVGTANGVSADGRFIVGDSYTGSFDAVPYIWEPNYGARKLSDVMALYAGPLPDGTFRSAFGISADGSTIVGAFETPSSGTVGFVYRCPHKNPWWLPPGSGYRGKPWWLEPSSHFIH